MAIPSESMKHFKAPVFTALVLAGVFSVLVMLPSLLQQEDKVYPFQGIHILGPDAEVYYAARVQEIYDGFTNLGSPFYSAPKDTPYLQPPFPEYTIAMTGKALSLDAISAFLFAKVVLSAAAFIAMALFLFTVTRRPWISVLSAFTTLTAGALLAAPWDAPAFLTGDHFSYEFLRFARLLHPEWTTTLFLFALACFAEWIRTSKRRYMLLAALLTTSLVYAYVYAWSYLFAVAGLLVLWFIAKRDARRLADLMIFWLITIVLSTPYAMHVYVLVHHPWYAESAMRNGMVLRHGPLLLGVWTAAFIGLGLASRKLWPATWPLLPAVAVAGFVALNQQLITGHSIVPHHYNWYYIQPVASAFFVAVVLSAASLWKIRSQAFAFLGVLLVAGSLSCAVIQQTGAYSGVRELWGRLQNAAPVLRYAHENLRAGQVIYSQDINIENLVPVFTSADVYFAGNANLGLVSTDRARFTYFFDLWLQGVSPEQATREFPTIRRFMLSSRLHAIYYREAAGDFTKIPDDEVSENVALFRAFSRLPLKQKLTKYPLTAIITTPGDPENPVWSQFLSCSREVYAANGYGLRIMIQPGFPGSCL